MKTKNLLLVLKPREKLDDIPSYTYSDEYHEGILSYTTNLAKSRKEGLNILLINESSTETENVQTQELNEEDIRSMECTKILISFVEECKKLNIPLKTFITNANPLSAIKSFLKQNKQCNTLLLSPQITMHQSINPVEIKKMSDGSGIKVVTMSQRPLFRMNPESCYDFPI